MDIDGATTPTSTDIETVKKNDDAAASTELLASMMDELRVGEHSDAHIAQQAEQQRHTIEPSIYVDGTLVRHTFDLSNDAHARAFALQRWLDADAIYQKACQPLRFASPPTWSQMYTALDRAEIEWHAPSVGRRSEHDTEYDNVLLRLVALYDNDGVEAPEGSDVYAVGITRRWSVTLLRRPGETTFGAYTRRIQDVMLQDSAQANAELTRRLRTDATHHYQRVPNLTLDETPAHVAICNTRAVLLYASQIVLLLCVEGSDGSATATTSIVPARFTSASLEAIVAEQEREFPGRFVSAAGALPDTSADLLAVACSSRAIAWSVRDRGVYVLLNDSVPPVLLGPIAVHDRTAADSKGGGDTSAPVVRNVTSLSVRETPHLPIDASVPDRLRRYDLWLYAGTDNGVVCEYDLRAEAVLALLNTNTVTGRATGCRVLAETDLVIMERTGRKFAHSGVEPLTTLCVLDGVPEAEHSVACDRVQLLAASQHNIVVRTRYPFAKGAIPAWAGLPGERGYQVRRDLDAPLVHMSAMANVVATHERLRNCLTLFNLKTGRELASLITDSLFQREDKSAYYAPATHPYASVHMQLRQLSALMPNGDVFMFGARAKPKPQPSEADGDKH